MAIAMLGDPWSHMVRENKQTSDFIHLLWCSDECVCVGGHWRRMP